MIDVRQSPEWASYLKNLGWEYENVQGNFVMIKKLGSFSLIKIQRPNNLSQETLKKIDEAATKSKALFVKIEPTYDKDIEILHNAGYSKNYHPMLAPLTRVIDLTKSLDTLRNDLDKDARYEIKKAYENGLLTKFIVNPDMDALSSFHKVLSQTGKERKFYVQPLKDFQAKIKAFKDRVIIANTFSNEDVITTSLSLLTEGSAFFEHMGSLPIGRKLHAPYQNIWELLIELKKLGIMEFDFEGVYDERFPNFTKNWLGFSFFKKKFGGSEKSFPYPQIKPFHPLLQKLNKVLGTIPI